MVGWAGGAGLTCVHCYTRNRHLMRAGSVAQGTLLDPWWPRREENPEGRGHVCTCGWFTSLYSRNQHTIKQLSLPPQQRRQWPEAVTDSSEEREKAENTAAGASEEQSSAKTEGYLWCRSRNGMQGAAPPSQRGVLGIWRASRLQVKGLREMIGSLPFWVFNSDIFSSMEYILIFPPGNNSFFPWHL